MARAGIGAGSLYRLFDGKDALVNAVFRDAKGRLDRTLRAAVRRGDSPRAEFDALWSGLTEFARAEPVAFRFLEMQDHVPYLDGESRQRELAVLAPILLACMDLQRRRVLRDDVPADAVMAFVWGAFVGLMKADRLGYVRVSPETLAAARDACFRAFAAEQSDGGPTAGPREGKKPWRRQRK